METRMSDEKSLRVMCAKCDTVYVVDTLPLPVDQLVSIIKRAECPHCRTKAWKSYIYTGA